MSRLTIDFNKLEEGEQLDKKDLQAMKLLNLCSKTKIDYTAFEWLTEDIFSKAKEFVGEKNQTLKGKKLLEDMVLFEYAIDCVLSTPILKEEEDDDIYV